MTQQFEGGLDDGMLSLLKSLADAHPDRGFLVVSVGSKDGREHMLTYSNMESDTVVQVAALIVDASEEAEEVPPVGKRH